MDHTRFLLIGGGITNLAFAEYLNDPHVLLCEASDDVGGYCRTIFRDGFVWDYSGHFFHFRHPEIESELVLRIGPDKVRKVVKDSRIHYRGQLIDFPFQKNIHQLPREDFLDCLVGLFESDDSTLATNFHEMLYRNFGRGISERFLVPYNEKLYATDLRNLDVDAMGRFFPHADRREIVLHFKNADNRSYNATFTYPEGGAIQYVRALQRDLPSERISLGERVVAIDLARKVARTERREIAFEHAISAVPFPSLLQMTELAHDPSSYSYNKVLVFNLGFDQKGPPGLHWIYYPEREVCFYRVGFYDNIFDSPRMSLYVEIGYPRDAVIDSDLVERMRERVLDDLRRVGVLGTQQLVAWHSVVLDPAYVHITRESLVDVASKKAVLETCGVHSIGRYGSWTYCSIEDNIVEARALAQRFNAVPR